MLRSPEQRILSQQLKVYFYWKLIFFFLSINITEVKNNYFYDTKPLLVYDYELRAVCHLVGAIISQIRNTIVEKLISKPQKILLFFILCSLNWKIR